MRFLLFFLLFTPLFAEHKQITLQLRWLHQFQFAGYYAAIHKGFYEQVGLNVTLKEGGPSINPVNMVMAKKAHFGVSNSSLVIDYLNGKDVVMLGAIFQHSPNVLLASSEFKTPLDLASKGVVSLMGGDQDVELKAMFLKEGIDLTKVNFVPNVNHLQDLLDKKVSAINAYSSNEPYLLMQKGVSFSIIEPKSYGLDFYGDTLFCSKEFLDSSSEDVKNFVEATFKGWEYALSHEDEMVEIILKHYNTQLKSKEHLRYEATILKKLINPDFVQIGHSNPGRWDHIVQTYNLFNLATKTRSLDKFYYSKERVDMSWFYTYLALSLVALLLLSLVASYIYTINIKLKKSTQRDKILFQNSASAGIVWDENHVLLDWNEQASRVFGWSAKEVIGKNFFDFLVPTSEHQEVYKNMQTILADDDPHIFINKNLTKDGRVIICEWHNATLPRLANKGVEIVSQAIDITQRYEAQERLKQEANFDPLTSLANRRYFDKLLAKEFEKSKKEAKNFGVAFIDLDGFKAVNDSYGHEAGDALLKELSQRFKKIIRKEDTIARIGGDEFALIFCGVDAIESCKRLVDELLIEASKSVNHNTYSFCVSASIGISFYIAPSDIDDKELLKQADMAMYFAKKSGKNRYHIY